MKIATWNVNSIKSRIGRLCAYLKNEAPDVLCLQEIKTVDENFPYREIEEAGYMAAIHGQKTYNGVAILSRSSLEDVAPRLPGDDEDAQARYLEAIVSVPHGIMRIASIYLPNGNPVGTEKYTYKLAWMERLKERARALLALEEPVVLAGDYNVIPAPEDVYDPRAWEEDALFRLETRRKFREILNLGYTDAFRALHREPGQYSFWDYQAGAWQKNHGLRIDHLLLSPQAADRLRAAGISRSERGLEKPSDHVPVWGEFEIV
jgi:exodeoxyribonuclease-3